MSINNRVGKDKFEYDISKIRQNDIFFVKNWFSLFLVLFSFNFFMPKRFGGVFLRVDYNGLGRTNGFILSWFWELRGNFVGISWEKLFFSWEFLGTFMFGCQRVTILFGNFVGKTFFFVGITWEKLGKNLGKSQRFEMEKLTLTILQKKKLKKKHLFYCQTKKPFYICTNELRY